MPGNWHPHKMILTHEEIIAEHEAGRIGITPWDPKRIGTNSYNVELYWELLEYDEWILDPYSENAYRTHTISENGFLIAPGKLYLGCTYEIVDNEADDLVPMLEGRSSIARLGLSVHLSAGFGDIGFRGRWTFELTAAHLIRVYPNMPIAQLYWLRCSPSRTRYRGKYVGDIQPGECRLWQEIEGQKFPERS